MRPGKITRTVWQRFVRRQLKTEYEDQVLSGSFEEMCFGTRPDDDEEIILSQAMRYGSQKDLAVFAVAQAVNDIGTRGADAKAVMVTYQLPPDADESTLADMMKELKEATEDVCRIVKADVQVSPAVSCIVVTATAVGTRKQGMICGSFAGKPGQDLVAVNWAGAEGMLRFMGEWQEKTSGRFIPAFLTKALGSRKYLFAAAPIRLARQAGIKAMHQVTDGGILAALWDFTEASQTGLCISMKEIPVRQETIEICELFGANPYVLTSAGCIIMAAEDGTALADSMREQGMNARVIGKLTADRSKIVMRGEEKSYLDKPAEDDFVKIFTERKRPESQPDE